MEEWKERKEDSISTFPYLPSPFPLANADLIIEKAERMAHLHGIHAVKENNLIEVEEF